MARSRVRTFVRAGVVFAITTVLAVALVGCAEGPSETGTLPAKATKVQGPQMCGACGGKTRPATSTVSAELVDGSQSATIAIEGGFYVPNVVEVEAGTPVSITFVPSTLATGCVAAPSFKALGITAMAKAKPATVDLGTLEPGTYELGCGMGNVSGAIVAH